MNEMLGKYLAWIDMSEEERQAEVNRLVKISDKECTEEDIRRFYEFMAHSIFCDCLSASMGFSPAIKLLRRIGRE